MEDDSQSQSESTDSQPCNSFSTRRAQLLARKKVNNQPQAASSQGLKGRLTEELEIYLKMHGSLNRLFEDSTKELPHRRNFSVWCK